MPSFFSPLTTNLSDLIGKRDSAPLPGRAGAAAMEVTALMASPRRRAQTTDHEAADFRRKYDRCNNGLVYTQAASLLLMAVLLAIKKSFEENPSVNRAYEVTSIVIPAMAAFVVTVLKFQRNRALKDLNEIDEELTPRALHR